MASTAPQSSRPVNRNRGIIGGLLAMLVLAGILLLIVWIVDARRGDEQTGTVEGQILTVSDIMNDPAAHYGETVDVSGVVTGVLGPFAYTIRDPEFAGDQEMLVIGPPPPAIAEMAPGQTDYPDDVVRVAGTVLQYDRAAIEEQVGGELPAAAELERFAGQPVIIGESVGVTGQTLPAVNDVATVEQILESPDDWIGERVSIQAEISQVLNANAFVLEGGLLVIEATDMVTEAALAETASVEVAGEVATFDLGQIEAQTGLDLDDAAFTQYDGQPVIIADGVNLLEAQNQD